MDGNCPLEIFLDAAFSREIDAQKCKNFRGDIFMWILLLSACTILTDSQSVCTSVSQSDRQTVSQSVRTSVSQTDRQTVSQTVSQSDTQDVIFGAAVVIAYALTLADGFPFSHHLSP